MVKTLMAAELSGLAAEFPGYDFATQQTRGGVSIVARRRAGGTRPGLYAVVTDDPAELRRALLDHERSRAPLEQERTRHQGD